MFFFCTCEVHVSGRVKGDRNEDKEEWGGQNYFFKTTLYGSSCTLSFVM